MQLNFKIFKMNKLIAYYVTFIGIVASIVFFVHKSGDPSWAFVKEEGAWVLKKDGKIFLLEVQ